MKICVVQTRAVRGDLQRNIENHKKWIMNAVANGADVVIFPELSLTGYEPTLAKTLATDQEDERFDEFQTVSDKNKITIGVGVPTMGSGGIHISMILFQPDKARQTYSKKYLHADEEPFFVSGANFHTLKVDDYNVAFAICYELSVLEHAQHAYEHGAAVYIASVAKAAVGVEKAYQRLAEIANQYAIPILMANGVGPSEDFESAGKTAVWNHKGVLVHQLGDVEEGMIIYDMAQYES